MQIHRLFYSSFSSFPKLGSNITNFFRSLNLFFIVCAVPCFGNDVKLDVNWTLKYFKIIAYFAKTVFYSRCYTFVFKGYGNIALMLLYDTSSNTTFAVSE